MNLEAFLALQEAIQPDWFVCLADTDISKESTKKRVKRAMTNSLSFLDKVLDEKKTSAVRPHNFCSIHSLLVGCLNLLK